MPQRNFLVLTQTIPSAIVRRQIKFVHNTFHLTHQVIELYSKLHQEFPGGLVVRILGFHCHGPGLYPGQATEILKAVQCGQKKKKITVIEYIYYRIDQQYRPYPLQQSCLENPMDRGAWQAAVHGVATTERLHFHFSLSCIREGNGNPLQCSCLENPRDGGAWWAAVYGVTQSWTRLKRLSSSSSSIDPAG